MGHEEPYAVQFSVFLANRVGQLNEFLEIFAEESEKSGRKTEVLGLSIVDSTDWAVIRFVFSDPNHAREILKKHDLPFTESDVLLVELPEIDALSEVCKILLMAEIQVHFAYALTVQRDNLPVMVFHVDELVTATRILTKHGFKLLGYEDLADQM